ncbi:MAG TPA: peptide chain release factor-like protein [Pirellulaceae bacterium]|nr:peptide chain release factor-like protein [Pirellulaceae bacterium]HMO93970.1 peptide chain release factor-like protein [Pirellulaceae bacterium]HMP70828.1 peptide chain release factor-like protein [Pirellulaceae bacterium]
MTRANPTMTHPAALPLDEFTKQCRFKFTRRSGPGGQHRNKVETAVVIKHVPSGVTAEANSERSQATNRRIAIFRLRIKLALELRTPVQLLESLVAETNSLDNDNTCVSVSSELWKSRCKQHRLSINENHDDFPGLLAEALDWLMFDHGDLRQSAARLLVTPAQLLKLVKKEPAALQLVNRIRQQNKLFPLK